jgi:hypothetical protein
MFQAPPRPGKYCWSLLIVSDSYIGFDHKVIEQSIGGTELRCFYYIFLTLHVFQVDINFVVHPEPEIPIVEEIWSDDEISLSDSEEDSDDDIDDK